MFVRDPLCPIVSIEPPDAYDPTAWEMDAYDLKPADFEYTTVQDVYEAVETNLWLADAYRKQRAYGLARECARAACREYRRFAEILAIYAGADFGKQVRKAETRLKRYDRAHALRS